jgi:hypothetical protein
MSLYRETVIESRDIERERQAIKRGRKQRQYKESRQTDTRYKKRAKKEAI